MFDFEVYILERPELLDFVPLHDLAPTSDIDSLTREVADFRPTTSRNAVYVNVRLRRTGAQSDSVWTDFRRRSRYPTSRHDHQIRSAKLFSIFRNWRTPNHRKKAVTGNASHKPGMYNSPCPRRMHHRKPSITPTIGLSEYNNRHRSGTTLN